MRKCECFVSFCLSPQFFFLILPVVLGCCFNYSVVSLSLFQSFFLFLFYTATPLFYPLTVTPIVSSMHIER
ncbi:hypothetical protein BDF14DRAFT_1763020 [Spinellus fusiger]|nr:hypothetical protein BDF14DRAFT_1763020 [Spinellus fusiger]